MLPVWNKAKKNNFTRHINNCIHFIVYSAYQKKGNPYSKAYCSKVNRFDSVYVAYK